MIQSALKARGKYSQEERTGLTVKDLIRTCSLPLSIELQIGAARGKTDTTT
jgi:hypothetical protein